MTTKEILLLQSFKEHEKFARELQLYPKDYPARIKIEKTLRELTIKINGNKKT